MIIFVELAFDEDIVKLYCAKNCPIAIPKYKTSTQKSCVLCGVSVKGLVSNAIISFICRLQGIKHFNREDTWKLLNIILLLYLAIWSPGLFQLFVSVIVLLRIKHWVKSLMQLLIAALP